MAFRIATMIFKFIKNMSELCFELSKYLCVFLLIIMSSVMLAQVILRYAFYHPLMWAESIGKICLIGISLLGSGMAAKKRLHIRVTILWNRFTPKMKDASKIIFDILILALFIFLAIFGYEAAQMNTSILWEFGTLRKMWFMMSLFICGSLASVQAFGLVLEDIYEMTIKKKDESTTTYNLK